MYAVYMVAAVVLDLKYVFVRCQQDNDFIIKWKLFLYVLETMVISINNNNTKLPGVVVMKVYLWEGWMVSHACGRSCRLVGWYEMTIDLFYTSSLFFTLQRAQLNEALVPPHDAVNTDTSGIYDKRTRNDLCPLDGWCDVRRLIVL